jgi:hypothetical protein
LGWRTVAAVLEEASGVSGGDRRKRPTDGIHECPSTPSLGPSQSFAIFCLSTMSSSTS